MSLEKPENINPYQPPSSLLSPPALPPSIAPLFYVVSKKKVFVLFITTFSLYSVYWFWEPWSKWREATGEKIWPVARTLFFTHSLFSTIESAVHKVSGSTHKELSLAATIYIVAEIVFNYMDAFVIEGIVYTALTILLIGILSLSMWQAQAQSNIASLDSEGLANNRFTLANYIWIVLGSILWLLIIIGSFIPDIVEW